MPPKTPMRMDECRSRSQVQVQVAGGRFLLDLEPETWTTLRDRVEEDSGQSASSPRRVTAEISKYGSPRRCGGAADRLQALGIADTASHLDATRARGRAATSGENGRELLLDHGHVVLRVAGGRGVDQVAEQAAALDVLQEPDAEPGAAVRALDQAGDVGHDERLGRVVVRTTTPRCGTSVVNG